jgi:hypothetical protein
MKTYYLGGRNTRYADFIVIRDFRGKNFPLISLKIIDIYIDLSYNLVNYSKLLAII